MSSKWIALPAAWIVSAAVTAAVHAADPPPAGRRAAFDPARFSTRVTNRYFDLQPRKKMIYETKSEDGVERVETYVTTATRAILGVACTVVRERVWQDGELTEDSEDYFAQDGDGAVWAFGEASKELRDGKVVDTEGSWAAGMDGAEPGILMPARPARGATLQPENSPGKAEDHAEIIAVDETITVPFGELQGCLRMRVTSPLEPDAVTHRCYCPEVGGVALEADPTAGEEMRLVSVEFDADPTPEGGVGRPAAAAEKITEEQARAIALKKIPDGKVSEVSIERKFGKRAWVIEVQVKDGPETDVIIDMQTGEILGTEI